MFYSTRSYSELENCPVLPFLVAWIADMEKGCYILVKTLEGFIISRSGHAVFSRCCATIAFGGYIVSRVGHDV